MAPQNRATFTPSLIKKKTKGGISFPESPRWNAGSFYYVDVHDSNAFRINEHGGAELVCSLPDPAMGASGMGWVKNKKAEGRNRGLNQCLKQAIEKKMKKKKNK